MPHSILVAQFLVLALTAGLFFAAFLLGLRHMHQRSTGAEREALPAAPPPSSGKASMGNAARATILAATLSGLLLLAWRAESERNIALPLSNHFDAFLVLGLSLAAVLLYFRWTRHLGGLSFFMLPMVAGMLALGGVLEVISPGPYHYEGVWTRIHIATVISGTACFALACVGAIAYLLAARRLKHRAGPAMGKAPASGAGGGGTGRVGFPPLASMEKFNQWMVYLGFPLLTIAMITGARMLAQEAGTEVGALWTMAPKLALALLAWLIYAILLHIPRSFRGRRAAWLSIVGFVLFLGGYIAVIWVK